jgi:hypothetical protein
MWSSSAWAFFILVMARGIIILEATFLSGFLAKTEKPKN